MIAKSYGKNSQVEFQDEADFYEFLGFLCRQDGSTRIVWELNDLSGAWTSEGRILFYRDPATSLAVQLQHTAGVGNIKSRVNCNDFVRLIVEQHQFQSDVVHQNVGAVLATIPTEFATDFHRGFTA